QKTTFAAVSSELANRIGFDSARTGEAAAQTQVSQRDTEAVATPLPLVARIDPSAGAAASGQPESRAGSNVATDPEPAITDVALEAGQESPVEPRRLRNLLRQVRSGPP